MSGPWHVEARGQHRAIFEVRTTSGRLICKASREHAALIAEMAAALAECTERLAEVTKGEVDDPSVGITGWDVCHQAVEEARAILARATIK